MITINNVNYVIRGSSEDNGTYTHYYYLNTIENTTNIIYLGLRGKITTTTTVYIDESTDQILTKDYFSWVMTYGTYRRAGVCLSEAEEQEINNMIDQYKTDDDGDTSNDNTNNGTSGSEDDDNSDGTGSDTGDTPEDNDTSSDKNDDSDGTNLFDNTMGSDTTNVRDTLPQGSDISNDNVINFDYKLLEGPIPKDTNISNKGTTYPIIRINDHYFQLSEIIHFSMESGYYKDYYDYLIYQMPIAGFIPTMRLVVRTSNKGLLKRNHVKLGDRCAVFFHSDHKMVKSMRCDFRITNVVTDKMDLNHVERYTTLIILGELYVPDLRNEEIRYNFNGSSRDAMMDAAKRLRLSFFFCDPDDTDDVMVWCNCKTPEMFIKDLTTHAWKNSQSFFESWIDPHYGLSFLNINKLLGEDGLDEKVDMTFWINNFINNRAADGKSADETQAEKVKHKPLFKMMTNIPDDEESATVYHVNKWRLINNALEILDFVGLNCKMQYESVNPGLLDASTNSSYSVNFSLCLNKTKFNPDSSTNDFYVLLGPARNMTYASADNMMGTSETLSSNTVDPQLVTNLQSDGDSANILATDNNMLSSGNTHRFYEVAYEHNMRNLLQLQKLYLDVELNGANLTIIRGEKMPIMLMDLDKASSSIHTSDSRTKIEELLYEAESGWYIIDGIEWVYDQSVGEGTGTCWRTNVKLVRREWPIPGKNNTNADGTLNSMSNTLVLVDIGNGQTVRMAYSDAYYQYGTDAILGASATKDEVVIIGHANSTDSDQVTVYSNDETGTIYTANGSETVSASSFNLDLLDLYVIASDKVTTSTIPLTGLKTYMKNLYKAIEEAADNNVKLVSARRWAVDENGNKVDGDAFVKKNGYYKCMNAIGEVMYFKKNNSKHLYGEAIDIINNNGLDFSELMTNVIMKSGSILLIMYDNGISAYIELAKDDTGTTTKHYHLGTDTIKQAEFWASVRAILGNDKIPGTMITFTNYMKNNNKASVEMTAIDVEETTITTNSTTNNTTEQETETETSTESSYSYDSGVVKHNLKYVVIYEGEEIASFDSEDDANNFYGSYKILYRDLVSAEDRYSTLKTGGASDDTLTTAKSKITYYEQKIADLKTKYGV